VVSWLLILVLSGAATPTIIIRQNCWLLCSRMSD